MPPIIENIRPIIKNMVLVASSIFSAIISMVEEPPLYNREFMDKFSDPEDKEKLDKAIQKLKDQKLSEATITLKNDEKVTIVIK